MIKYVYDCDILESNADAIVNTVNTEGVMGKGLALKFKKKYPEMYEEYRARCLDGEIHVGKLHFYRSENKIVINFPTKKEWRKPSQLEYVREGLKDFVSRYKDLKIMSVSFPLLGCSNGKLDWRDVKPIMEEFLEPLDITVYVHVMRGMALNSSLASIQKGIKLRTLPDVIEEYEISDKHLLEISNEIVVTMKKLYDLIDRAKKTNRSVHRCAENYEGGVQSTLDQY